jgi:hypothetical protein
MNKEDAKITLPDGRVAYDCAKLAHLPTEGFDLKDYREHVFVVRTRNTIYQFTTLDGQVFGKAFKPDGSRPKYLAEEKLCRIHGSTWGGSMMKIGYLGVEMHLEFSFEGHHLVTSEVESITVAQLQAKAA